ncbi:MAG: hypothetical protein ACXVEF_18335 [Polyangiales bacterium]
MRALVFIAFVSVVGCDSKGTCEVREQYSCEDTTKSVCASKKDGYFISDAHCSTLGYSCRDNDGVLWKPGHGNCR